jgi:hypothetical protein
VAREAIRSAAYFEACAERAGQAVAYLNEQLRGNSFTDPCLQGGEVARQPEVCKGCLNLRTEQRARYERLGARAVKHILEVTGVIPQVTGAAAGVAGEGPVQGPTGDQSAPAQDL